MYERVNRHMYPQYGDVGRIDIWESMCIGMTLLLTLDTADMCTETCSYSNICMHVYAYREVYVSIRGGMRICMFTSLNVCVDMGIDMYKDMCEDMCIYM